MPQPIELTSCADLSHLQTCLDQSDMNSLPVRHVLWHLREGIITKGHVYVDQWPEFTLVCALHTSEQFISKDLFDFDVASFYQASGTDHDFEEFLSNLATNRGWTSGRSLYAQCLLQSHLDTFQGILGDHGKMDTYGQYFLYTGMNRSNLEDCQERLKQLVASLEGDLEADTLRASDVDKVITGWPYGPLGMIPSFFAWLFDTFPSTCLRKDGELVAWAATYNCGAIANLYIEPAYRGRGLSEYLWLSMATKLGQFSPVQVYFDVALGNEISERSARKAFRQDYGKGDKITTWFFFYNRKQFG